MAQKTSHLFPRSNEAKRFTACSFSEAKLLKIFFLSHLGIDKGGDGVSLCFGREAKFFV